MARLKAAYKEVVVPALMERFKYLNIHQVPKMIKIVLNIGVSEARENPKVIDSALAELSAICGQKPIVKKAKKSISSFKVRQGMSIGLKVTLRANKMYEFFDRLVNISIPRIRDFKGLNVSNFDGMGNYNLGLLEQYIFPEINLDKSDKPRGMNITIVTTAKTDEEGKELLSAMGMPFKKKEEKKNSEKVNVQDSGEKENK